MRMWHLYNVDTRTRLEGEFPYVPSDPNHGLPLWVFEDDRVVCFEVDEASDEIQWWSPIGPAPHWTARYSEVREDVLTPFMEWMARTY